MTRDEIRALDLEQLEERANGIAGEIETADADALETLSAELDMVEERKNEIHAEAEEKRAAMEAVIDGAGEEIEKREEIKKMDSKEVRKELSEIREIANRISRDMNRLYETQKTERQDEAR